MLQLARWRRERARAACCHSLSVAPLGRLYSGISRSSEKKKKADYLCPNRVVSLETRDAIISTRWVIIADQAGVSVRDARRWMRQSLTNEGFYMCEVRRGGVPRELALAARLLLIDWFFFSLSVFLFNRSCFKDRSAFSRGMFWPLRAPAPDFNSIGLK